MQNRWGVTGLAVLVALALTSAGGCAKKTPPVARPAPPPTVASTPAARPAAPPEPVAEPKLMPPASIKEDVLASGSLDDVNRNSPLRPVFFDYDSAEVNQESQRVLEANADVLKKYATWVITIEGHCDERGTAEYNLALGERRAASVRTYLVSLGIPAGRIRTISYGKEFPFDPGHGEAAWAKNRRGHFVITQK